MNIFEKCIWVITAPIILTCLVGIIVFVFENTGILLALLYLVGTVTIWTLIENYLYKKR